MTTAAQVKRWLQPLLTQRSDLTLRKRMLVMRPVRHVLRRMYFNTASWDKRHPKPYWYLDFLPSPPFWRGHPWFGEVWGGYTNDPGFVETLNATVLQTITERFDSVAAIGSFLAQTHGNVEVSRALGYTRLENMVNFHGPVLAAAGQLTEAADAIDDWVRRGEQDWLESLAEGRRLLAKRANSGLGKVTVRSATEYLALLDELKKLALLCRSGHRLAIADMLRSWELHNVSALGLADIWEPAPYPLEQIS